MTYRTFTYQGQVTDRIDFTDGEFTTPIETAIAEVAAALGVPASAVQGHESPAPTTPDIEIPPTPQPPPPEGGVPVDRIAVLEAKVAILWAAAGHGDLGDVV